MNILALFLILRLPFYVVEPQVSVVGTTVVVSMKTQNPSAMPNIYYSDEQELTQKGIEIYEPKYLENIWYPDTVDTFFQFVIKDVKPGHVYLYQLEYTDLKKKKEVSTKGYKFRVIVKDGKYRLGGLIDLGPVLGNLRPDGIDVMWRTNFPSQGEVVLNDGRVFKDTTLARWHRVSINGLSQNRYYTYRIRSYFPQDTFRSRPYRFHMPDTLNFKFAVFGDTRANWKSPGTRERINGVNVEVLRKLGLASLRDSAAFIIVLGDLIKGYTTDTSFVRIMYETWWWALEPVSPFIPVFTVMGNHDASAPLLKLGKHAYTDLNPPNSAEDYWLRFFPNPLNGPEAKPGEPPYKGNVYYFKIGDALFVALNPDYKYTKTGGKLRAMKINRVQYTWADSILRKYRVPYKFLFWHEPLFPVGGHEGSSLDLHPAARDSAAALALNNDVIAVFNAHEHFYARVWLDQRIDFIRNSKIIPELARKSEFSGFYEIISGGGGAPSYEASSGRVKFIQKFSPENHYIIGDISPHGVKFLVKNQTGWVIDKFSGRSYGEN